jgi:hypothetical protein
MSRSNILYVLIIVLFAIPFIGAMFITDATLLYAVCLAFGVILFLVRILRGDD